jgi:hypothetical protein
MTVALGGEGGVVHRMAHLTVNDVVQLVLHVGEKCLGRQRIEVVMNRGVRFAVGGSYSEFPNN